MRPFHGPRRLVLDTNNTEAAGGAESRRPSPPQSRSSTRGVGDEAKFDSNMVIILAALLCALIFALGLNSIVRCALRCSRRLRLGPSRQPAAAAASRGLEKSKLRQIPVGVYRRSSIPSAAAATDCPICLGEFVDGDKVKVLPICGHGFHARCIDIWLSSHSSCPTCRHSLITELPMMTPAPPSDDQNFRQLAPSGGHADFPEEVGQY